jgi:Kef-type K+ transport system membrane component KefB
MNISILFLVGAMVLVAFYGGKLAKLIKFPSIIGYMIVGVLLGPSLFNILDTPTQNKLSFLTDIALGFVALSIGLELNFKSLKKLGGGIITVIFTESLAAFILVTAGVFILTRNLPLSLVLGAIAPASAPAGTVAVIQEYKAKGSLTDTLYAVVGFDDGLGIIIFGFASAIAQNMLKTDQSGSTIMLFVEPLMEILAAIGIGIVAGIIFMLLARTLKNKTEKLILIFALTLSVAGLSIMLDLSLILTNMVYGIIIVNTQSSKMLSDIKFELENIMPLVFVIFFTLAGANLHISALPSLGVIGAVYIVCRTVGLMGGATIGASLSKMDPKIKKYLGFGIISQAGVAIGLALNVKQNFSSLGPKGLLIGTTVITMVTATSIFFEFIGPPLTKFGLAKSGEINILKD